MKKLFTLIAVIVMVFTVFTANADVLTSHEAFWGPTFLKAGTAYLTEPSQNGYILLSVSSSPDVCVELLDQLDLFCSAADFFHISDYVPGCSFISAGKAFYKYVDKGMTVKVQYSDPNTGKEIWTGTLTDGSIMELGCDHPGGYTISFKSDGLSYPHVQLIMLSNVSWSR